MPQPDGPTAMRDRLDAAQKEFSRIADKQDRLLELLQGPLDRPQDGLVSKVNRALEHTQNCAGVAHVEKRLVVIEQRDKTIADRHRKISRVAWSAIASVAVLITADAWEGLRSWLKF